MTLGAVVAAAPASGVAADESPALATETEAVDHPRNSTSEIGEATELAGVLG